jgi:hypothetical protein
MPRAPRSSRRRGRDGGGTRRRDGGEARKAGRGRLDVPAVAARGRHALGGERNAHVAASPRGGRRPQRPLIAPRVTGAVKRCMGPRRFCSPKSMNYADLAPLGALREPRATPGVRGSASASSGRRQPVLLMGSTSRLFGGARHATATIDHYPLFLLCGYAPVWRRCLVGARAHNANLIRKTRFPAAGATPSVLSSVVRGDAGRALALKTSRCCARARTVARSLAVLSSVRLQARCCVGVSATSSSIDVRRFCRGSSTPVSRSRDRRVQHGRWSRCAEITRGRRGSRRPAIHALLADCPGGPLYLGCGVVSAALGAFVFNRVDDQIR